jgi:NADH dehydrogenase
MEIAGAIDPHAHRVVVIGSGFGGLFATKALRRAPVEVTLIDRSNHHLFQPLLYQVATGILSEGEIAPPTREVLRKQKNVRVLLGDVTAIDVDTRQVMSVVGDQTTVTPYDSLIVAAGAGQSYFGNDQFAEFAPGMKSVEDALELRGRIFGALELAELEPDPEKRAGWLTFVVVGAGPTGVEMAGQLAELSRHSLKGNFTTFDPADNQVILVEAAGAVLATFGPQLSAKAERDLRKVGVDVRLHAPVVGVDAEGVDVGGPDDTVTRIPARTVVWAAGVSASPLGGLLAKEAGAETNRNGQVAVEPDCTLVGHPEVFVVGDMMQGVPGVAQVAIQSGRFAAKQIRNRLKGKPTDQAWHYRDKGSLATISRLRAIASVGPLKVSGLAAWLLWLVVHLVYLVGFRNRYSVLMHWAVTFLGNGRAERTASFEHAIKRSRAKPAEPADTTVGA